MNLVHTPIPLVTDPFQYSLRLRLSLESGLLHSRVSNPVGIFSLLLIYLVTWRWPSKRTEICRQPNNKVNIYKQLCCNSLKSFSLLHLYALVLSPQTCHMVCPSHSSWFDHPADVWRVQIKKLIIMQYSPLPLLPRPIGAQISSSAPYSRTRNWVLLLKRISLPCLSLWSWNSCALIRTRFLEHLTPSRRKKMWRLAGT